MFERFTRAARAVVVQAEQEAAAGGAREVDREHLLLALAADRPSGLDVDPDALREELGNGLDADALAAIGIDLDEVRRRVEASFGPGALRGRSRGHVHFARGAKKTLELSLREALALGDRHIGSGHILLALMRDPGDRVVAALARHDRTPDGVRAAALAARSRAA